MAHLKVELDRQPLLTEDCFRIEKDLELFRHWLAYSICILQPLSFWHRAALGDSSIAPTRQWALNAAVAKEIGGISCICVTNYSCCVIVTGVFSSASIIGISRWSPALLYPNRRRHSCCSSSHTFTLLFCFLMPFSWANFSHLCRFAAMNSGTRSILGISSRSYWQDQCLVTEHGRILTAPACHAS